MKSKIANLVILLILMLSSCDLSNPKIKAEWFTINLEGQIIFQKDLNANSGVVIIDLNQSNIQYFNDLDSNKVFLGIIERDTAYFVSDIINKFQVGENIELSKGEWTFSNGDR